MDLLLLPGPANLPLAGRIAHDLGATLAKCRTERFPDGELHVELETPVRGRDVYVLQPTSPPADENLLALLFLGDACRRAGAGRLTAVVPYFGYARQDRRAGVRAAVGARLVADLIERAGFERVVAVDVHGPTLEGFFRVPLENLTAVPLLADAARPWVPEEGVIVAPDLGAARLAERYAAGLDLPVAIIHKTRLGASEVRVRRVTGDVRERVPVLVDDMITTAGTMIAALVALREAGTKGDPVILATHGLFVGSAGERLRSASFRELLVTDTVAPAEPPPRPLQIVSVSALLATAISALRDGRSLAELRAPS